MGTTSKIDNNSFSVEEETPNNNNTAGNISRYSTTICCRTTDSNTITKNTTTTKKIPLLGSKFVPKVFHGFDENSNPDDFIKNLAYTLPVGRSSASGFAFTLDNEELIEKVVQNCQSTSSFNIGSKKYDPDCKKPIHPDWKKFVNKGKLNKKQIFVLKNNGILFWATAAHCIRSKS